MKNLEFTISTSFFYLILILSSKGIVFPAIMGILMVSNLIISGLNFELEQEIEELNKENAIVEEILCSLK